jgi:predicted nucleic acid-binding protein
MKIKKETLTEMKILVSNIEKIDCLQRTYDNLFIIQGYSLDLEQLADRMRIKKLKKKYQKRINKIIKNL